MKKLLSALVLTLALSPLIATADVGESTAGRFVGVITAVETERDSFTVENSDGQVKMFEVSASRKNSLEVGQNVSVGYIDDYQWPLKTTSISGK